MSVVEFRVIAVRGLMNTPRRFSIIGVAVANGLFCRPGGRQAKEEFAHGLRPVLECCKLQGKSTRGGCESGKLGS